MIKNKIYFVSDFHLGSPNLKESHSREKKIINWLSSIEHEAHSIYFLGDIFDFWFEYKKVVPKGFVRFLWKIADLREKKIDVHLFLGNHDMWMKDYLAKEVGLKIHYNNKLLHMQGKKIFIGHGDAIGNGDYYFKIIKKIFKSKICQKLFSFIHPDIGLKIAHAWSRKSKSKKQKNKIDIIQGFCEEKLNEEKIDYFIFGHTHTPKEVTINKSVYINVGDWISSNTFAVLENGNLKLEKFNSTCQE